MSTTGRSSTSETALMPGTIIGVAGVQGALSSRVSLFLEGRYGAALQKNDDDVRATRIVGQLGVRLKF
jgi:hypothetical protein